MTWLTQASGVGIGQPTWRLRWFSGCLASYSRVIDSHQSQTV
jgi:hypothetical protein